MITTDLNAERYQASPPLKKKPIMKGCKLFALAPLLFPLASFGAADTRPNIVMIVADDAGYSDFAGFGGEANTPVMDSLASVGNTLTNFHAMPNCSPSRAAFLTGIDGHINGVPTLQGALGNPNNVQVGTPGYKGFVNDQSVMVSSLLKDSGYHTYMVGKWHLGEEGEVDGQTVFFRGTWPIDRGFQRSYGILNGGAEHFGACERVEGTCTRFFEDDQILIPTLDFPPDYFSAMAHTDKALEFIASNQASGADRKPFFLYYADTMPHEPNQLPPGAIKQEYIDRYLEAGWDGIRAERFQKLKDLGLIPETLEFPDRDARFPAWDDESDPRWGVLMSRVTNPPYNVMWGDIQTVNDLKRTLAKKMALYIGMVELFDEQVGRIVTYLQDNGEYDNTVFFYFSDNGGDSREWDWLDRDSMLHRGVNNSFDNIGGRGSFVANGPQWAQAVNTPLYGAKATVAEGGIRDAMVAAFPGGDIASGARSDALTTVMDLAATILDYAEVSHPVGVGVEADWDNCTGRYNGEKGICPMNGKSMRTVLTGNAQSIHDQEPVGYEIFGRVARDQQGNIIGDRPNKALFYEQDGQLWKALRLGDGGFGRGPNEPWRLYNLTDDISEANDLGPQMPDMLAQMMEMYNVYEQNVGVIPQSALKETDVKPGTRVNYLFPVTNRGAAEETYNLSCRSDWPCTITTATEFTLAPGESMDVGVRVRVPSFRTLNQTRTTQVEIARLNQPQLSTNQILVTQTRESRTGLRTLDGLSRLGSGLSSLLGR